MNSLKSIRQGFFQQKETQSKNLSSQSLSTNAEFFYTIITTICFNPSNISFVSSAFNETLIAKSKQYNHTQPRLGIAPPESVKSMTLWALNVVSNNSLRST